MGSNRQHVVDQTTLDLGGIREPTAQRPERILCPRLLAAFAQQADGYGGKEEWDEWEEWKEWEGWEEWEGTTPQRFKIPTHPNPSVGVLGTR